MSAGSGHGLDGGGGGEAAVSEGELGCGGETGGLGAVAGGFEAFAFGVGEGVVSPGLFGFACHGCFVWCFVCVMGDGLGLVSGGHLGLKIP